MKIALSAIALLVAFAFGAGERSALNTYYYFCTSRPVNQSSGKQVILYTAVQQVICEEQGIGKLTTQWGDRVVDLRKGQAATSDLNYYLKQDYADSILDRFKRYYGDTSRYVLTEDRGR